MGSSFGGLNIGISGIFAQQRALDVTGHNISNANTAGYSRQVISHASAVPEYYGRNVGGSLLQMGTGVDIQSIKQYRDEFLDSKLRKETGNLGYWQTKEVGMQELEAVFSDNSQEGLQAVMDNYWNSWTQLAKPTGGLTARALVKESAIAFVETVKNMDNLLTNFRKNKDTEINETVTRVNKIAKEIANLNYIIKKEESIGASANDLRDNRANLIDELSKLAKIEVREDKTLSIMMEGTLMVEDGNFEQIEIQRDENNDGFSKLAWASTKNGLKISGGSIKAMFEIRDQEVERFRQRLNELVTGVATEVNAIHIQGFGITEDDPGNRNMFINKADGSGMGINIQNIEYNPELNQIDHIAAGKLPNNIEDNTNALELSELRRKDIFSSEKYNDPSNTKYNFDDFYRNLISDIGLIGQEATQAAVGQKLLVNEIENSRQAISGVSLDEEMSNLIKYEHSYNAAVRIVNAMDEMLEVIVNKIGLVGR